MIMFVAAVMLAGADSAEVRHGFVECLKTAVAKAKTQNVGADGFVDFARSTCAGAEQPFKSMLTDANVKHGMSKKASATDASQQVSDYYSEWQDNYSADLTPASSPK
jgi:hypothetical protein